MLASSPVRAADLGGAWPNADVDVAVPAPIWRGVYIGGFGGGQNTDGEIVSTTTGATKTTSGSSGFGGVYGGYNWQSGALVLGFEGDWAGVAGNSGPGLVTFRGRAGWAFGNILVYATAGGGAANGHLTRLADQQRVEANFLGFVAGGGVEAMLTHNISIKAEALYFDSGSERVEFQPAGNLPGHSVNWDFQDVIYRAGIAYHFN